MADYTLMSENEFDTLFEEIVAGMSAGQILAIGDVRLIMREELNNEVLSLWEERNPEKAFPDDA